MADPIKRCCYDFKQKKCIIDFSEQLKTACVFIKEVPKDFYVPPPPPLKIDTQKRKAHTLYFKNLFKGVKF